MCKNLVERKWFDNAILLFIALNCITLAMERPNIPPDSTERIFLSTANYIFTVVFAVEMFVKVVYERISLEREGRVFNDAVSISGYTASDSRMNWR
jgi:hypothetical protein